MNKQIHIGIAENHLLSRQGLISLLKDHEEIKVLFSVTNGKEVFEQLKTMKPHILLLDIDMPVMGGAQVMDKLKIKYPEIKVIVITAYFNEPFMLEFVKKGVNSFLSKDTDFEKIIDAIYMVDETGTYFDNKVSVAMANLITNKAPDNGNHNYHGASLTDRELDILKLICLGKTSTEIAKLLNLSKRTVDGHRYMIMKKTNTKNSLSLITYAIRHNIVSF